MLTEEMRAQEAYDPLARLRNTIYRQALGETEEFVAASAEESTEQDEFVFADVDDDTQEPNGADGWGIATWWEQMWTHFQAILCPRHHNL